jgi:hypothetical protein
VESLDEKIRKQIKSIHSLLVSTVDSQRDGEESLCIQQHLDSLEHKLAATNMNTLKFVAKGLELRLSNRLGKVHKVHWVNELIEWVGDSPHWF